MLLRGYSENLIGGSGLTQYLQVSPPNPTPQLWGRKVRFPQIKGGIVVEYVSPDFIRFSLSVPAAASNQEDK